jgi:hypothetical protein
MKFKFALLIALLTVVATAQAQEHEPRQPKASALRSAPSGFPVRLGNKTIFIPDPEGFEEATAQFVSFKKRVETTEAPQNDMLGAHLPVSDCELLRQGLLPTYNLYTKVSVMKIARELDVSAGEMAAIVDDFRKNLGAYLDPNGPAMKQLDKHLEEGLTNLDAKETKVDFSKPQQLGEFDMRIDVRSFLMLMSFTINSGGNEQTQPMLATTSFVRVKDRVIFAYTFMKYRTKADIDTIKQFTTKWTDNIVAANK